MAETGLTDAMYAGNKRTLAFAVKDTAGAVFDITAYGVQFALSEIDSDGIVSGAALVSKSDDDVAEIAVTDAANGLLQVYLVGADTAALLGDYHFELELVDDADSETVVVAEGTLEIRRNVVNA